MAGRGFGQSYGSTALPGKSIYTSARVGSGQIGLGSGVRDPSTGEVMAAAEWKLGDRVVHAGRPEWGIGEVRSAESVVQDGKKAQRLTIRFERAGVKVISTTFADLRPAGDVVMAPAESEDAEPTPDRSTLEKQLVALPEAVTDPFRTRRARLEATLGLYRFTGTGSSLLDWAASQTSLKDPLSAFSRHELEHFFEHFRIAADNHLRKLVAELKRADPVGLAAAAAAASPNAKQALKRADAGR